MIDWFREYDLTKETKTIDRDLRASLLPPTGHNSIIN